VHLSFLGDIYDLGRKDNSYTRQVLDLFRRYRHPFQVLTKGGLNAVEDFDLYFDECRYGATLTFIDESDSLDWEPKSALPAERLESLEKAKACGIKTWVSCEPVIDPAQTLELIREAAPYVDFFAIGKINHYPDLEAAVNWRKFKSDAETLLQKLNKSYLIKNKLKAAAIWQETV
jgi:DNA repair photolyase